MKMSKLDASLAKGADMLFKIRERRYALQHKVDELKAEEVRLKEYLIAKLPQGAARGIAGKICRVEITTKEQARVQDWEALWKHVQSTGQFDLLQRRLSEPAVKERWNNAEEVPGVGAFTVVDLSIHSMKGS